MRSPPSPSTLVARATDSGICVGGHFGQLTPQATSVLDERGWIFLPSQNGRPARLSLAGRLNLEQHRIMPPRQKTKRDMVTVPGHRTETFLGPLLPNDRQRYKFNSKGLIRGYVDRDGAGARCECGWTAAAADRSEARDRARQHRIEQRDRLREP